MSIGMIGASFLLGIAVGCCTLARLGDIYGRKPIFILGMGILMFFYFILIFTTRLNAAYFILFIIGIAVSGK
jgi:MFS family permease